MDSSPVAIYRIHEHLRPKVTKRSSGLQTEDALFFLICIELDPRIVGARTPKCINLPNFFFK